MESRRSTPKGRIEKMGRGRRIMEVCFFAVLLIYPLRHVFIGGDLWDVGYNYGNFVNFSEESLGTTWFFSTYLAGAVGHLLTLLPFGRTMLGLNIYTGLTVSLLAIMGYLFFTKVLNVSPVLAFLGEMIAVSMCWCPTALLYNYLTYILFFACLILLYQGLRLEKRWMLVLAGACLGVNLFVRFSNLPEMGLILAVWAYALWDGWERRGEDENLFGKAMTKLGKDTLLCLLGYLGALFVFFTWIALRYEITDYVKGIRMLFAMTESATDYKPTSMLQGLIWPFKEAVYWITRLGFFVALAFLSGMLAGHLPKRLAQGVGEKLGKPVRWIFLLGVLACSVMMVFWMLWKRPNAGYFTSFQYHSYDAAYWPCALFWMLALGIGAIEAFRPGNGKINRFYGVSLILVGLLTSLGSNNGIYPSFNNLFAFAPFVLDRVVRFSRFVMDQIAKTDKETDKETDRKAGKEADKETDQKADKEADKETDQEADKEADKEAGGRANREMADWIKTLWPGLGAVCVSIWAIMLVCAVQMALFGWNFVFCEGTGVQHADTVVVENKALRGIHMNEARAKELQELTDYANAQGLAGREVILHGNVPAVAFYLQMRPAIHSWNDLASFDYDVMQDTMDERMNEISVARRQKPVVIAEKKYASDGPIAPGDGNLAESAEDPKWELIQRFMGLYGYEKTFENEKFVIWQAK